MEIRLNVTEDKFNDVLQKELEAFSSEELHDIIGECIRHKLLNDDDLVSKLLVYDDGYYGGKKPSKIMERAAEQVDLSPAYKEIQDNMISYMKEHYEDMMIKIMSSVLINGLTNRYDFQKAIQTGVAEELIRRANN